VKLRVLVVDDEAPARRKLRSHLVGEPGVEVVGEVGSGTEAVGAIRSLKPDLVFLDVQMPGMTGLDVIEAIGADQMPAVIFVTAYDEFALEAFEVQAVDYLLKPFSAERFRKALTHATQRVQQRAGGPESLEPLLARLFGRERRFVERLLVREGERLFFVPVAEIARLSAEGNYVAVRTATANHLVRETLAGLEARLDPERFARVHRSELVNLEFIQEIQPLFHGDYLIVLKNGEQVRLSRRFRARLLGPSE
jgi:two-component system LytT family response regulator